MADDNLTEEQKQAFQAWWSELTRQGDPLHIPNKFSVAFKAGWKAAIRQVDKDLKDDVRGAAVERIWQERQGEDYGTY